MSPIALLPSWPAALERPQGFFPIADGVSIPAGWGPELADLAPAALPTPFGRAEAMRLLLADLEKAGNHEFVQYFQLLLLGIASGKLDVECDDLGSERYDNLGRALLSVEPTSRYFCHIRWPGPNGQGRSFGLSHVAALVWPHARRTKAEWSELANDIQPLRGDAVILLSEWRAALRAGRRWEPSLPGCEWQRGVDHLLGREAVPEPSVDLPRLRSDCRFVGPVWLGLPTGLPSSPVRFEAVYLPCRSPGFGQRFAHLYNVRPTADPKGGGIVFADGGTVLGRIAIPPPGVEANALALGAGLVEIKADAAPTASADDWVNGKPGAPGLLDLLRPLVAALEAPDPGRAVDAEHVSKCPALYPDPIRLLFDKNLWPLPGKGQVAMSRRLRGVLVASDRPRPDVQGIKEAGGQVLELGGAGSKVTAFLLDELGGTPVLDLRALGAALFQVFTGVAKADGGKLLVIEPESPRQDLMLESTADRPLEAAEWVYAAVAARPPRELTRRLATLQRFVRACADPTTGLHPALDAAARAYAAWANNETEVAPLGRPVEQRVAFRLATGEQLLLPIDPIAR